MDQNDNTGIFAQTQFNAKCFGYLKSIENDLLEDNSCELESLGPAIIQLLLMLARSGISDLKSVLSPPLRQEVMLGEARESLLKQLILRSNSLIQFATDKLHAYPYKDVPVCWRRLYGDACILKAIFQLSLLQVVYLRGIDSSIGADDKRDTVDEENDPWQDYEVIHTLDMALIMSGVPGPGRRSLVEQLLALTRQVSEGLSSSGASSDSNHPPCKRRRLNTDHFSIGEDAQVPELLHPIPIFSVPPVLHGFEEAMSDPFIIKNLIQHWPAMNERPWSDPAYLLTQTHNGKRLVPVEIGKSYTDSNWSQRIIPFRQFLIDYIFKPSEEREWRERKGKTGKEEKEGGSRRSRSSSIEKSHPGYLAQHDLFSQIQCLRNDISVPDYCYMTRSGDEEPMVNAWLGPAGTISPLHTDPYKNILCQVVGRKYVRLYNPETETDKLFPRSNMDMDHGGVDMSNTSGVKVEWVENERYYVESQTTENEKCEEDEGEEKRKRLEMWEAFKKAKYVEGILEPGDGLFIPRGWWHYIRSLDVSFSVSFWWD